MLRDALNVDGPFINAPISQHERIIRRNSRFLEPELADRTVENSSTYTIAVIRRDLSP